MSLTILIMFHLYAFSYAEEDLIKTKAMSFKEVCALEYSACAQLKSIDLNKLELAKENKNPSSKDKEDLLTLTRCLFKEELPTSDICKAGLQQKISSMTWFQRRLFKNFVL